MKITGVEVRQLSLESGQAALLLVKTDGKITGIGEIPLPEQPDAVREAIKLAESQLLGCDPFEVLAITTKLHAAARGLHLQLLINTLSAAIEAACLDLVGKQLGVSTCQLFGGAVRNRIRLCAVRWDNSDDEPAIFAQKARAIAQSGFTAISFDPFAARDRSANWPTLDLAAQITGAIRDAVGTEIGLIANANGRFTLAQAVAAANALEPFDLISIMDPLKICDVSSLDMVAKEGRVPVALSARTASNEILQEAVTSQRGDFISLDPYCVGGISSARNLALLAETYYMGFALDAPRGPVGMAINACIAACAPNFTVAEVPYPLPQSWDRMMKKPFELQDGYLLIGSDPGWGIEASDEQSELAMRSGT